MFMHPGCPALQLCFFAHTPEQLRVTAKSLAAQQAQANSGKGKRSKAAQQAKALSANSSTGELLAQFTSPQAAGTEAVAAAAAAAAGDAAAGGAAAAAAPGFSSTDTSSSTQAQEAGGALGPAAAAAQLLRSMLTDEVASSALMQQLNAVGDDADALDDATAAAILTMLDQLERQQLGGSTGSQSSSPVSEDSTSSPPSMPVRQTMQFPALAGSAQRKDTAPMAGAAAASGSASAGPVFGFGMDTASVSSSTRPLSWQSSGAFMGKPAQLSVQEHISAVMQGRVPLQDTARVLDVTNKPSPAAASWGHTGGLLGLSPAHSFTAAAGPTNSGAAFLQHGGNSSLPNHGMQGIGLGVSPSAAHASTGFLQGPCPAAAGPPCSMEGFDPDGLMFSRHFTSPGAMGVVRVPLAVSPGGPAAGALQVPGMRADLGYLPPAGACSNTVHAGVVQSSADAALCRMLSGNLSSSSSTCAASSNMVTLVGADRTVRRCSVDALSPALIEQLSLQVPAQQGLMGGLAGLGHGMSSPHISGASSLVSALSTPADFAAMAAAAAQQQQLEAQQALLLMQQQQHGVPIGLPRPAFAGLDLAAGHLGPAAGQQLGGTMPGMAGVGFPAKCSPAAAPCRVGMPA
jgi:hypothetical protein